VSRNVLALAARQALRILLVQAVFVLMLSLVSLPLWGLRAAGSVLAGGAIGSLGTVYMAATLLKHSVDHGVRLGVLNVFFGWLVKLALIVSLLILAFRSGRVAPLPLLGGLFGAMLAYWASLTFWVKHADNADGE
jgi:F0F1-type ATP synthase assembly protein I